MKSRRLRRPLLIGALFLNLLFLQGCTTSRRASSLPKARPLIKTMTLVPILVPPANANSLKDLLALTGAIEERLLEMNISSRTAPIIDDPHPLFLNEMWDLRMKYRAFKVHSGPESTLLKDEHSLGLRGIEIARKYKTDSVMFVMYTTSFNFLGSRGPKMAACLLWAGRFWPRENFPWLDLYLAQPVSTKVLWANSARQKVIEHGEVKGNRKKRLFDDLDF